MVEFKAPYNGWEMDPKDAFILDTAEGEIGADGQPRLKSNHLHYFQVQTQMAVRGTKTCDFVIFANKGILIVEVNFDEHFWAAVVSKVYCFYKKYIIPALLLQIFKENNRNAKTGTPENFSVNTPAMSKKKNNEHHPDKETNVNAPLKQPDRHTFSPPLSQQSGPKLNPEVQQLPESDLDQSKQSTGTSVLKHTKPTSRTQSKSVCTKPKIYSTKLKCTSEKHSTSKLKHTATKKHMSKLYRTKLLEPVSSQGKDFNSKKFELACKRKIEL